MRKLSALQADLSVLQHWQQIAHAGVSASALATPSHPLVTANASEKGLGNPMLQPSKATNEAQAALVTAIITAVVLFRMSILMED